MFLYIVDPWEDMKPKMSEWQPLDLVDKEVIQPLRSFNSRVASRDHRYYTLNTDDSAVYDQELDNDDNGDDDDDSVTSEVEFINQDPIEDHDSIKHKKRWQKLRLVLFLGVIMITCLVVVVIFQHFRNQSDPTCTTTECVKSSAYILNKMDTSINPCDDFYTFSCGNWEKTTTIPPSKPKYTAFSQISDEIDLILKEILEIGEDTYNKKNSTAIHQAFQYYNLCMDTDKIDEVKETPLVKLINDLGGWGFTNDPESGTLDLTKWNLQDAVLLSHRLDFPTLFSMGVSTDERNSSHYMIKFEQSGLTLSDPKEYFTNHSNHGTLKNAYMSWLTHFVTLIGNEANDMETQVKDLYDFEQNLAQIFVPHEELLDPQKIYHNMTLKQFQDDYLGDMLDINQYMSGMFEDITTINLDTVVIVYTPDYFTKLQQLINDTPSKTLANYVVWIAAQSMSGYLYPDFVNASLILEKVESGLKELPPRWKRCLGKVTSSLGFAVSSIYVGEHFKEDSKKEVDTLLEEIRSSFISNLYNLNWMDDKTRQYAVEKAKSVSKMLGYPDYITDIVKLDKEYENLTLSEGNFFESRLLIRRYFNLKNLRLYGTIPDRTKWAMFPTEVNGYYSSDFNHIVFPAGILRPPLFDMKSPRSFNFGSFGMICGHELTHGFDNNGRKFDKDGDMRDWWSESSADSFEDLTKCFVDFYHNYTVNGTHLNGETTLGENIADNGGMKMAYLAYKKWLHKSGSDSIILPGMKYNSDQLFFIGMAQVWCSYYTPEYEQKSILVDAHSIARFRVLGSMSNSMEFARTFNCPKNSAMNPEKKCQVW
ncbi:Endothelin-converting enzyme 2 [Mactra antiquata]